MMRPFALLALGGLLGFSLSRMGFSSWDEVHAMFTFADLRLLFTFLAGVTLLALALGVVSTWVRPHFAKKPIERGTLVGGVIFGIGWALSGACPAVAVVQIGEGSLYAIFSLGGIFAGNWLYGVIERRAARPEPVA